jgi:hypothetical protein
VLRPEGLLGGAHRRSYLCPDWELRITRRCLVEDLDFAADLEFEKARTRHDIVKAFVRERADKDNGAKTVSPLTCGETIYRLAHGDHHRGATWLDEENAVIWLCAYGWHESGTEDDAFPHFKALDADDRLLPDEEDYVALAEDEGFRFAEAIPLEAADLLKRGRAADGGEERAQLGGAYDIGCSVESAPPFESVILAISTIDWGPDDWDRMGAIVAAFGLGEPDALGNVDGIATRKLYIDEIGVEFLREPEWPQASEPQ